MKTVGQILKEARLKKNYSLGYLEEKTKIKKDFIESIENEKWESLPPFATVLGFVKNVSTLLGLEEKSVIAVLKRDYPPRKLNINPKPDVSSKFIWSPKLTFALGTIAILVMIFGYLIFQYLAFISPPTLNIDSPKDNQVITGASVLVFGTTNGDAKITVNNQPVIVSDDGKFSVNISVVPETKEIIIKAISRSGKETVVRCTIKVE
ncbi:MAG TPA: helix-turn-helix domain-containing protein [Patescibacteria group bacterium]|nr:helix-turn-helix domain-containing protein [Patescibacteria group bacterium]